MILVSWSADHFNARGYHAAGSAIVGGISFLVAAVLPPESYRGRYGCLIVGTACTFAGVPAMLGWLTSNLWSTASIGLAVGINVSCGGAGSMPSVWIYKADEALLGYPTGHAVNCAMLFLVAISALGLRYYYGRQNRVLLSSAAEGIVPRLYKL